MGKTSKNTKLDNASKAAAAKAVKDSKHKPSVEPELRTSPSVYRIQFSDMRGPIEDNIAYFQEIGKCLAWNIIHDNDDPILEVLSHVPPTQFIASSTIVENPVEFTEKWWRPANPDDFVDADPADDATDAANAVAGVEAQAKGEAPATDPEANEPPADSDSDSDSKSDSKSDSDSDSDSDSKSDSKSETDFGSGDTNETDNPNGGEDNGQEKGQEENEDDKMLKDDA